VSVCRSLQVIRYAAIYTPHRPNAGSQLAAIYVCVCVSGFRAVCKRNYIIGCTRASILNVVCVCAAHHGSVSIDWCHRGARLQRRAVVLPCGSRHRYVWALCIWLWCRASRMHLTLCFCLVLDHYQSASFGGGTLYLGLFNYCLSKTPRACFFITEDCEGTPQAVP